jgi:anti-sigma regulatory factor (Ser/Thr protein kinase)
MARALQPFAVRLPADPGSVPALLDETGAWLVAAGLPEEARLDLVLALDEAVANVIQHGYRGGPGELEVEASLADGEVELRVIDRAPPFDPLVVPPPDLGGGLERRPVGGLGVHLIRMLTDRAEYRREGGRNVLVLHKGPAE